MKAAVYYQNGGPEVFRYEEVADPVCGPDEVLIRVDAISIEGGDLVNREIRPLARVPHIVGYQCAGTISETGDNVRDRHAGDRVVAILDWGSHAQYATAPAADTWIIPAGLDLDAAAAIPVAWGTAYECLFTAGKRNGADPCRGRCVGTGGNPAMVSNGYRFEVGTHTAQAE